MAVIHLTVGELGRGSREDGVTWAVTDRKAQGIVVYGPYKTQPAGRYVARFEAKIAGAELPFGDPVCLHLDVMANQGATKLAESFVTLSRLAEPGALDVVFELHEPRALEYRVWTEGQVALKTSTQVEVERLGELHRLAAPLTPQQAAWRNEREFLDGYLRNVPGLIHVGANLGQERRYYWLIGLDVVWVEPIREIYDRLVDNISAYPRQRAYNALLTGRRGEQVRFGIANNNGASSSVLPLQDHATLWPDVVYSEMRTLTSTTLTDLVAAEQIPLDRYPALTLDVEGAEKMVLEGGRDLLQQFRYIKCEAADFPARTGTPSARDLDSVLRLYGFQELARRAFAMGPGHEGTYWDIVWKRAAPGEPLHEPGVALPLVMNPVEVEGIEKCE